VELCDISRLSSASVILSIPSVDRQKMSRYTARLAELRPESTRLRGFTIERQGNRKFLD
jgi:hypothetical protein